MPRDIHKIRAARRKWYAKNKNHAKNKIKERKEDLAKWLQELKSNLTCKYCPENRIPCLDFHHRNPEEKEKGIPVTIRYGWSKERILKEIEKCDILCSNCHRWYHYNEKTNNVK